MGACLTPADAGVRTGLSAAIFFALASQRKKGFPLQSLAQGQMRACLLRADSALTTDAPLARKTGVPSCGIPLPNSR
jgi:hypothetical protein